MYLKKLVGEKCYLAPLRIEDAPTYAQWINDMETSIGLTLSNALLTVEKEKEILTHLQSEPHNFAIVEKQSDTLLGAIGLIDIDYINRRAGIGIFIGNKKYLGKGIGTEAMRLLLDFAFNILSLYSVYLKVYAFNKIACRCYEKIGFRESGRLRAAKWICGKPYDEIYMDLLAEEFTASYIQKFLDIKERTLVPLEKLFLSGDDYEMMLQSMPPEHEQEFRKYFNLLRAPKNERILDFYRKIFELRDQEYRILVFAESFCPDCHINTAALNVLSTQPNIRVKFVSRDQNLDIIDNFREGGQIKIPAIVVMDENFRILGSVIERPERVKNLLLNDDSGESKKQAYLAGEYLFDILEDILSIINQ